MRNSEKREEVRKGDSQGCEKLKEGVREKQAGQAVISQGGVRHACGGASGL